MKREIHHCHWPGCTKQVPPKLWGCREHWYTLPMSLRKAIYRHYVPGQEITKTPSPAYIQTAKRVQAWIQNHLKQGEDSDKASLQEVPL